MMHIEEIIGSNIKKFRLARGLTQEELAELTGLHRTYVGSVERGERNVSAKNIARIASALDIEPFKLLMKKDGQ